MFWFVTVLWLQGTSVIACNNFQISFLALKNFGMAKAQDADRLEFISSVIGERAELGLVVVDEIQDSTGKATAILHRKIQEITKADIACALSPDVGRNVTEQFGFFWNTDILTPTSIPKVLEYRRMYRNPVTMTFKAVGGFDFLLCAFHLRPSGWALKQELQTLDNVINKLRKGTEKDIICLGDFNAPPDDKPEWDQTISIKENLGKLKKQMQFVVNDTPTNVLGTKLYDNIFFHKGTCTEYRKTGVSGEENVGKMLPNIDKERLTWFYQNVLDHRPVHAVFSSTGDDD